MVSHSHFPFRRDIPFWRDVTEKKTCEREGNQIEKKEQKETQGRTVLVEQGRAVRKTISFQIIPRKRTFLFEFNLTV